MNRRATLVAGLAALCMSAAGAGCGSEEEGAAEPQPADGEVAAVDFAFEPEVAEIVAGESVTWTNEGETIHNVKGKGFFSEAIEPGVSYERRFAKPGTNEYLCNLHPQMVGTIEVAAG